MYRQFASALIDLDRTRIKASIWRKGFGKLLVGYASLQQKLLLAPRAQ